MATIGQLLTSPESGWQRIDDNNSKIFYYGNGSSTWVHQANNSWNANNYNNTFSNTNNDTSTLGCNIKFNFYGSKIRIISIMYPSGSRYSANIQIQIDNTIFETFSEYSVTPYLDQRLVYEKTGLNMEIHTITIKVMDNYAFGLDAIDIDSNGYLLSHIPLLNSATLTTQNTNTQVQLSATNITDTGEYTIKWQSKINSIIKRDFDSNYQTIPYSFPTQIYDISDFDYGSNTLTITIQDSLSNTNTYTYTIIKSAINKVLVLDNDKLKYISSGNLVVALSNFSSETNTNKINAFSTNGMAITNFNNAMSGNAINILNQLETDTFNILMYKIPQLITS